MELNKTLPGQTGLVTATRRSIESADHLGDDHLGAIKQLLLVAARLEKLYKSKDAQALVKESNLQFLYLQLLDKLLLTPSSMMAAAKKAGVEKSEEEEALDDLRNSR